MSSQQGRQVKWARRVLVLLIGSVVWTLWSSYPNPAVLARNLARYRRLPIDPQVEKRMGWALPDQPGGIESFVDSLLVPTPDWQFYRVPWYVPTALEAARARHGDCESKAILLGSLLAGKSIPFEVRASFHHIWIDYAGRRARPGEEASLAYLEGKPGRLGLHWPGRVRWADVLAVQREQLWGTMPLARKALWLTGLLWVALAALLLGGPQPEGAIRSNWRAHGWHYLRRAAWLTAISFLVIVLAPAFGRVLPSRWILADLREAVALAAAVGAMLAWLSIVRARRAVTVAPDGTEIEVQSSFGLWQRDRRLTAAEITHLHLDASPGGLQPWVVSAVLRSGERVPLARLRDEVAARAALRTLGCALTRALVVQSEGIETRTTADEIPESLRERARRRPPGAVIPRPGGCDLQATRTEEGWLLRCPAVGRGWVFLLGAAFLPALLVAGLTYGLLVKPWLIALWAGWVLASSLLGLTIYLALVLRAEIVGRLANARVEIGDGELRFHSPEGRLEHMPLDEIESVELARIGETPTVAVVSPDRVIHVRGLCPQEHRTWVRQQIEQAILGTP